MFKNIAYREASLFVWIYFSIAASPIYNVKWLN